MTRNISDIAEDSRKLMVRLSDIDRRLTEMEKALGIDSDATKLRFTLFPWL